MLNRRSLVAGLALSSILAASGIATAKGPHKHHSGHGILGAKLKKNGKHTVGKAGKETVTAEVNNGKVVNMSAGSLPVKKVKSKKKMAGLIPGHLQLAANGDINLAQMEIWYYGFGFDTGEEEIYYWYTADEVIVTEIWIEYTM